MVSIMFVIIITMMIIFIVIGMANIVINMVGSRVIELIERAEAFYSSELLTSASRSSARGRTLWFRAACSRTLKGQVSCFLRVLTSPGSEARKTKRLQRWRKSHVASCIAFVHFLAYNDKHKPRSGNPSKQLFLLIHCFRLLP